jgi:LAO/AO transport system kinase
VLKTVATKGDGLPELMAKLDEHRKYLRESGELDYKIRNQISFEINHKLKAEMLSRFNTKIADEKFKEVFNKVYSREISPQEAVEILLTLDS